MSEKVYVKGLRCFSPHEKAPSFVLGTIVIDVHELVDWINNEGQQYLSEYQDKMQLKLDVLKSDKTGVNIQVNTYKKK